MKKYGRTAVSEFLGDFVVYRNLAPMDPRLPSLAEIREPLGLAAGATPRKSTTEYARVIAFQLQKARSLEAPRAHIKRVIYVGDTRLNDGAAFLNICQAGNWPGLAFIGAEQDEPAQVEIVEQSAGTLYIANRWGALADFERFCRQRDFAVDERSVVLLDIDKTALGARGRNDHVIDRVRVDAATQTVGGLLGDEFNPEEFRSAYQYLNRPEFHPFTGDNQDYLVYICLILGGGLFDLHSLVGDVHGGELSSFEQFIARVDGRAAELPSDLRGIHAEVFAGVKQGDPTPFKAFRCNEYRATAARMGQMEAGTPVGQLLSQEIVITQEVQAAALAWRSEGALIFGLSDKPDEASIPSAVLQSRGYKPIHQIETDVVGG